MLLLIVLLFVCVADENIENLHKLWNKQSAEELYEKAEALHYSGQFVQAYTLIDYMLENHFSADVYFLWGPNFYILHFTSSTFGLSGLQEHCRFGCRWGGAGVAS